MLAGINSRGGVGVRTTALLFCGAVAAALGGKRGECEIKGMGGEVGIEPGTGWSGVGAWLVSAETGDGGAAIWGAWVMMLVGDAGA